MGRHRAVVTMSCNNDPFDFASRYASIGFEVTAGGGTCIDMQVPKYLAFDGSLNPDSVNWMTNDNLHLVDALAFSLKLSTWFNDSFSCVDGLALTTRKPFADSFTFTEQLTKLMQWQRNYAESVTLAELVGKIFMPATVDESVTLTDAVAKLITKRFADVITLSETFSNGRNQNLADTFALHEAGVLNTQNYFDTHTYFAGDYFGETRTW
jgi:hypothetical protein